MKYIIFDETFPVLFHEGIPHNKLHASLLHTEMKATSAGFLEIFPMQKGRDSEEGSMIGVECHGESVSLKLKSHPKVDNLIIEKFLNEGI